jgi:hypothetical protein
MADPNDSRNSTLWNHSSLDISITTKGEILHYVASHDNYHNCKTHIQSSRSRGPMLTTHEWLNELHESGDSLHKKIIINNNFDNNNNINNSLC